MAQLGLANITVAFSPFMRDGTRYDAGQDGDTIEVTGWSDDADALLMPDEFEIMNTRFGASGDLSAFRTGMRGGDVTIKLLPTSPTVIHLMKCVAFIIVQNESGTPDNVLTWDGSVTDHANKYKYALRDGVLVAAPLGVTIGSGDAANRMFRFSFPQIIPEYDGASFDTTRQRSLDVPLSN